MKRAEFNQVQPYLEKKGIRFISEAAAKIDPQRMAIQLLTFVEGDPC